MSKKSEAKKAALAAAQKAAVLFKLLGLTVVLEAAWTEEGTGDYPSLGLDPKQKKRVTEKWRQIVRWRDAVCQQNANSSSFARGLMSGLTYGNVMYRDMSEKHAMMERCISAHCASGRAEYNVALVVETIVISALLVDWMEEHGWVSTNEFYWFLQALNTFSSWTCKPDDPAVLLASIVYYEMRDKFLESPDWSTMYVNAPLSESTAWAVKNPCTEFSQAARAIVKKYGGQDGR